MRLQKVRGLVVHQSASTWGDAAEFDRWHRARGWSGLGYHAVILNGRRTASGGYRTVLDGKIEPGRDAALMGAHCAAHGMNAYTLGVCLTGYAGVPTRESLLEWKGRLVRPYATERQMAALVHWLSVMCRRYGLDPVGTWRHPTRGQVAVISQHSDHDVAKPVCASLVLSDLRRRVAAL